MLPATPYIVKMFEWIAWDVQNKLGVQIHYEHGHPVEIDNILQAWSKTPTNSAEKYPMIALLQDFDERRGRDNYIMADVGLELLIATMTKPDLTANQRMAVTFVPVLYPIYHQFLESVAKSGYFANLTPTTIKHTKTDRMFWGRTKNAAFGDYVDAIHIQNLNLRIKNINCKK